MKNDQLKGDYELVYAKCPYCGSMDVKSVKRTNRPSMGPGLELSPLNIELLKCNKCHKSFSYHMETQESF